MSRSTSWRICSPWSQATAVSFFIANRSCNSTVTGSCWIRYQTIQNDPVIFPVIGSSVLTQPIRMTQLAKRPSPFSAGCWQQTLRISTISTKVVPVHVRADVITSSSPLPRRPQQNGNPFIVFSLRSFAAWRILWYFDTSILCGIEYVR